MATTSVSLNPPPDVDPAKSRVAFGSRALPKIKRELNGEDDLVRRQAITSLCELVRNPEHIMAALEIDICCDLKALLEHKEDYVREKTAEALVHFAGHAVGRKAILECPLVLPLSKMFNDSVSAVQKNAHTALERTTEQINGADAVVRGELVPILVKQAGGTDETITELALDTLHNCLKADTDSSLEVDSMQLYKELLGHSSADIRSRAARNIFDLTVPLEGKRQALKHDVIEKLVPLLSDKDKQVRSASSCAIMSITVTTPGKLAAITAGAPAALSALLGDENESVVLNAIKAMTTIAEAPAGRQAFLANVDQLQGLMKFSGNRRDASAVARAAEVALKTVTWKP